MFESSAIAGPSTSTTPNYGSPAAGDWLIAVMFVTESPDIVEGLPSGEGFIVALDNGSGTEIPGVSRKFVMPVKQWGIGNTDDSTPTFTWGGSSGVAYGLRISDGGEIGTPVAAAASGAACPSVTVPDNGSQVVFIAINLYGGTAPTAPTQGSLVGAQDADGTNFRCAASVVAKDAGASGTCSWTGAGIESLRITLVLPPAITFTAEVEGYRWRNDDGSETSATWRQSQDTADTVGVGVPVRLRTLVNFTGDPGSTTRTIQVRLVGDSDANWETIS